MENFNRHILKRNTGGKNELSFIQTTCSCGWVGNKVEAYNDYQHATVKDAEERHLKQSSEEHLLKEKA